MDRATGEDQGPPMSDCCTPDSGFCAVCAILTVFLGLGPLLALGMVVRLVLHV